MTAPAAPVIRAINTGTGMVRVAFEAVEGAIDYDIYLGDAPNPTGLEDQLDYIIDVSTDGSFVWFSGPLAGPTYVRVKAVNALAEASSYSNEKQLYVTDEDAGGNELGTPTAALLRQRQV